MTRSTPSRFARGANGRLTAADYSPQVASDVLAAGEFFHYAYDAVGNRLTEATLTGTDNYTYDAANRLTTLNATAYSWDANGNLLSDGARSYAYDHANRLASVAKGTDAYSYSYNGLGDRLRQAVNGVATNYTLDIEAGLTQVLADGTSSYLYGVSRIAQEDLGGKQYFLGDALASVRELAQDTGLISLARAYEPFGELSSLAGRAQTAYGFTGEWRDGTGLQHLRARYYAPAQGRFLQPDPFPGMAIVPGSLNPYLYGFNNPLRYMDPTGRFAFAALLLPALIGGVIGLLGGGVYATLMYNFALSGDCGCEMQL